MKEEKFPHIRNPFTGGGGAWQGRSCGAIEKSTATVRQRAKWKDSHTEDWCAPSFNSLRGLSAHPLG